MSSFMSYFTNPQDCPDAPHRGPQGPNEDLAQCHKCLSPSFSKRPVGETYGLHIEDCSLDRDHFGYCKPGGKGHPEASKIRGYFGERFEREHQQ